MSATRSSLTRPPKDQYHHVIPRFILRQFQIGTKKTNRERHRDFRKLGFVDERIWFYDIENRTLDQRLISGVYGVTNLYRDIRIQDVDELEKKLSVLESTSARIIHNIHTAVAEKPEDAVFSINRGDLEQLRKFLFIMHYRNEGLSLSYFSPTHPENAPARKLIENRMKKFNLNSPKEMWFHWLRYYLDTPYSQIGLDAIKGIPKDTKDMMEYFDSCMATLNPDAENCEAITFQTHAEMYYLGIAQAAPGEEFVLGHNSFGLWEGVVSGIPGLHRLYVVSPRIALILRLNTFRPEMRTEGIPYKSDLLDINLLSPIPRKLLDAAITRTPFSMLTYKASIQAKSDQYFFPITKLSKKQTYLINTVILVHSRAIGSFSFLTPKIMRSTIRTHWRNKNPAIKIGRIRYEPLIRMLTSTSPAMIGGMATTKKNLKIHRLPAPIQRAPPEASELPTLSSSSQSSEAPKITTTRLPSCIPKSSPALPRYDGPNWVSGQDAGYRKAQLEKVLTGAINRLLIRLMDLLGRPTYSLVERYKDTRSFWAICENTSHILSSHIFISRYRKTLVQLVENYPSNLRVDQPRPSAELVETLDLDGARNIFSAMDAVAKMLGIMRDDSELVQSENMHKRWAVLTTDVVILGFTSWMAKNSYRHLDVLLKGVCISHTK